MDKAPHVAARAVLVRARALLETQNDEPKHSCGRLEQPVLSLEELNKQLVSQKKINTLLFGALEESNKLAERLKSTVALQHTEISELRRRLKQCDDWHFKYTSALMDLETASHKRGLM